MASLAWRIVYLLVITLALISCEEPVQRRPYGVLRLARIADLREGEVDTSKLWIKVLRDDRGIAAMSTLCTRDLEPLVSGSAGFSCPRCGSSFSSSGEVTKGPAIAPLPTYELELGPSEYGGPVDLVYVRVGWEQDPAKRLALPELAAGQ